MRVLWISLCVTLIIAFVEAQRTLNSPKPVVSFEKRLHPPAWRRPPEERRKLSIFPKNNKKFVVTERTAVKNEVTSPAVTTKRPLMRKLFFQDKIQRDTSYLLSREPMMKPKPFNVPMASQPKRDNTRNYKMKKDAEIANKPTIKTVSTSVRTESSVNKGQLNRGNLIQELNKINEHTNVVSSKQVNKVIQNNDSVKVNSHDKVFEEPAIDVSADSFKENMTATKINEQVEKVTEKVFSSNQVDNVMQNNESSIANSLDTVSEEDSKEGSSQSNVKLQNINEKVNKITEKNFLSKQINNVIQNNDSLKVNVPDYVSDEYVVDEGDSNNSDATLAEIIKDKENESTTHIFTEDLLSLSEAFEGRSADTNDLELNDKSDHTFLSLNNKKSSNEKIGDSFNEGDLEIFMKVIAKDYSDHKPLINSNDAKPLIVSIQDINAEAVIGQQRELDEKPNIFNYLKPVIGESHSRITTDNNIDVAVTEIMENNEIGNTDIKANSETNKNDINDIMIDLDNLIEAIISNSTLPDIKALTADSQILILENTDRFDTISSGYHETTPESDYASLTESPIEIIFDNDKTLSAEITLEEPSLIGPKKTVVEEYATDQLLGNVVSMVYDSVTENSEKIKYGDINIFSGIVNLNVEESTNNNNANSSIIDNLYNLAKVIESKSTVDDGSEVAIGETQLVNLDMNIVEEYSDKPNVITIELEVTTDPGSLTESLVEVFFDSQETSSTEKNIIESDFNENIQKIVDKSVTNELGMIDEIIPTVADPVIEVSLKIEDGNTNTKSAEDLAEVVNDHTNASDNSEIAFNGIELQNHYNIIDEEIDKPDTITVIVEGTYGTQQTLIEGGHGTNAPIGMFFSEPSLDMYTTESVTGQLNLTEETITKVEDLVKEVLLKVEDGHNKTKNDSSSSVVTQEEISDEMTVDQSENLTDEIINETNILNDSLSSVVTQEDVSDKMTADESKNLTDEISNESHMLNDSSSSVVTQEEMSDEITTDQSKNLTDEITNETNILNASLSSVVTQEDIFDKMTADDSKNLTDEISNESHMLNDSSSSIATQEEISDEMTADHSKNLTEEISNVSHMLNYSSSSVVTQETISDEMTDDQSKNLTDEISNESHMLTDSSSSVVTQEEISDEMTADESKNLTDEITNETNILHDSPSSVVTQEGVANKMTADLSKNLTDEISNESHVLSDSPSSFVTNEVMSDEMTPDQSKNLTDEISNESRNKSISKDSSSSIVTNEEVSDEITAEKTNNMTDESSNESSVELIVSSSDLTGEEKSEELTEKSKNLTGEGVSNAPVIDIRYPSAKLTSNEMLDKRIKRSNNVIEEENLATTSSVFKYTGYETRLGHDLSFKNINA